MEKLRIKCPKCGAVLQVNKVDNIENRLILCYVCKETSRGFKEYIPKRTQVSSSDETQYGPLSDETQYSTGGDETQYCPSAPKSLSFGKLVDVASGRCYPLSAGMNIVGRQATTSTAAVQITTDDRHMSRSHAKIEVKTFPDGEAICYLSNSENKNPTYVNNRLVENADRIILQNGDMLKFGTVNIKFEK